MKILDQLDELNLDAAAKTQVAALVMCQHFSGHKVKLILAAFRSPLATNSY